MTHVDGVDSVLSPRGFCPEVVLTLSRSRLRHDERSPTAQGDQMKPRMSRRGLLRIVVVSGAAGAAGFALTEPAEAATGTVIAGTVVSADADGMVVRTADATITVTAAAGAKL